MTANREKGEANAAKEKALEQVAMLTAKNTALEVCIVFCCFRGVAAVGCSVRPRVEGTAANDIYVDVNAVDQ